jgi:integrase
MSVFKRGKNFHYRFMLAGKTFSGPCVGCSNITQAAKFEAEQRRIAQENRASLKQAEEDIRKNKTVRALVENYRLELSGGSLVAIDDAYGLASAKPSRREAGARYALLRETYWKDYAAFLHENFPDVSDLSAIRRSHCEAYVRNLVDNGRFLDPGPISPKTVKEIVSACKWVMGRLEEDAGILSNPWNGVVLPAPDPTPRDVFSGDELMLIWDNLARDTFCLPLFIVAANSGMTEGDICTLRWEEIDFLGEMIRRSRRKTGTDILAPLLPELAYFFQSIPHTSEYVFPEHARMYLNSRPSVPRKVKAFLESLGIVTTVNRHGRNVSVKDLHSLRHVFAYRARKHGVPEHLIAKTLGHKVLEMTRHYADHDTEEDMKKHIQKLPALFLGERGADETAEDSIRRRLAELAYSLPLEQVRQLLRGFEPPAELPKLPE